MGNTLAYMWGFVVATSVKSVTLCQAYISSKQWKTVNVIFTFIFFNFLIDPLYLLI